MCYNVCGGVGGRERGDCHPVYCSDWDMYPDPLVCLAVCIVPFNFESTAFLPSA